MELLKKFLRNFLLPLTMISIIFILFSINAFRTEIFLERNSLSNIEYFVFTAFVIIILAASCTSTRVAVDTAEVLKELKVKSSDWYKDANPFFYVEFTEGALDKWDSIVKEEGKKLAALEAVDIPLLVSEVTTWDMEDSVGEWELYTYYYRIIMEALYQRKDQSVQHLVDALEKGNVSVEVAFLLGKMKAVEQVRPVFDKSEGRTKLFAAIAIARAGDTSVVGFLLDHCDVRDGGVPSPSDFYMNRDLREAATVTYTLAMMGEKISDLLYEELCHPESDRYIPARLALRDMDFTERKAANGIIARLLKHPDENLRLSGAEAIRFYDSELAALCVKIIQEDKSEPTRPSHKAHSSPTLGTYFRKRVRRS